MRDGRFLMKTSHKVVYFCDAIFLGGAEEYLKLLVPEIPPDRFQISVVLSPATNIAPLARFFEYRGITVDYFDSFSSSPLKTFLEAFRYFRREKPTIVHFNLNNTFSCFFPILAAYLCRVPWKLATDHLGFELAIGKRAGIRTKKLVKRVMTFCLDYTLPVSKANKQLLVEDYKVNPHRLKLIRNGINLKNYTFSSQGRCRIREQFKIDQEQILVGTVARFSFQKGHQFSVEAIPRILESCPQARFIYVGEGPTQAKVEARVRQLGLESFVTFTGAREDIADILSALDIFLLTSLYEGLPLSILEAMAIGLPVIATEVSGTPEAVKDQYNGLLIQPENSEAVAAAVTKLIKSSAARSRMGRNGLSLVNRQFDKNYMIKQVENFYEDLVSIDQKPNFNAKEDRSRPICASLIVLTWNKKEILKESLDALIEAVNRDGGNHEIMLVDNGSTDGTQDFVRIHYPQIRIIELEKNYRFCRANNIGVKLARNEIVVLLNNDVIVRPDFIAPLLRGFEESDVFAVTSQIFNYGPSKVRQETGKTFGMMMFGSMHVGHTEPSNIDEKREYVPAFYGHGGSSAFSREKFLKLGGFSEIYYPAYVEDTDLSYRAWKAGFRVLFCPASQVVHKHRSTNASELGNARIDYLITRNLFLFFWRNISSVRLFFSHVFKLPLRFMLDLSQGRFGVIKGFVGALSKLPWVISARILHSMPRQLSDEEAISASNHWFFYRHKYLANKKSNFKSRKILMVSKRLPRLGVDGSWILVNLIKALSKDHDITLLVFIETNEDQEHVDLLKNFCKKIKTITLYPYDKELKSAFLISKLLAVIHACLMMRKEVLNELRNGNYDLVHCEYLHTLNFIPDLSKYPSLVTHHEVLSLVYERLFHKVHSLTGKISCLIKWRLIRVYEKQLCQKVQSVVTLSSVDQNYLSQELDIRNPVLAQSGIDLSFYQQDGQVDQSPKSLIFVGFFKHPPNVQGVEFFLDEIWPSILSVVPDTTFTIIGRNPPSRLLTHSKKGQVTFLENVEDLRPYLAKHAVFVAPIITGAGLRGKILEAMAMGTAVVSTRLCIEGYPFQHNRELMIADDAKEFGQYVIELFKDDDKRRMLGQNARLKVEQEFSSSQFAASYETFYKNLSFPA